MEEDLGGVRKDAVVCECVRGGLGLQAEGSVESKREDKKRYSAWKRCWVVGGREGGMVGLGEEGRDRRGHQGSPSILQFPLTTRYP